MRQNKDEIIEHQESLITLEERVNIEYIMWQWNCDRSLAQHLYYESEGKSLKRYEVNKDVWDLLKNEVEGKFNFDEFDD
tara:strand:- start:32 stop:268 length:237 start_codon:yes stop_codon:yes gene_type:complete